MNSSTVAITGLGMITGLGLDLGTSWKAGLSAISPIKRFTLFDPKGLSSPFGVELPQGAEELFCTHIKKRHRSQMTRGTMIAVVTANMAIGDAALEMEGLDHSRVGVIVGSTGTGYTFPDNELDKHRILRNMSNSPASWISLTKKLSGPSFVLSTACSSGVYALASAFSLIQDGQCDVVIAGAADSSLNYLDVQGFSSILALSEQEHDIHAASKPFDKTRNGFVMGEGGGFLVLESTEFARNRGAHIYAKMPRPALSSETYNIMSPEPEGKGMAKTMSQALDNAGLLPEQIDYINAHGTSTRLNDLYETQAIKAVFGSHAVSLPISSTKSMTGHCLAGAAGIEAVFCCKALKENMIPPTANLNEPDPELDLDYVPHIPRQKELHHVMCNSFAFGGHNGVCIFSQPD
ncbi:MAG: beta-ketoacyl-[acyl-carrier-protein] synthase family protein [Pseudomonadota bacterium]